MGFGGAKVSTRRQEREGTPSSERPLPLAGSAGPEHRIDDRHILDGIFERHGNFRVFANRFRKPVALNRILIARRNGLDSYRTAARPSPVDIYIRGAIQWRTERHFEFDASACAKYLH